MTDAHGEFDGQARGGMGFLSARFSTGKDGHLRARIRQRKKQWPFRDTGDTGVTGDPGAGGRFKEEY